jgi:predicted nucleic acid-binding protein
VPTFTLDANGMVAAVCAWHEHHAQALAEIEARLNRGERLTVAAPALVEAYAVLTRLPAPHRLAPSDAWQLLDANFAGDDQIVALSAGGYRRLLRRLAKDGVAGGRTYDAVIGECARHAGAAALLTFNRRHFDPPPDGVAVIEPGPTR